MLTHVGTQMYQCRGLATEATKAIIEYGFHKMNLHKVQICTKTINTPSKRVIEKCGFTYLYKKNFSNDEEE